MKINILKKMTLLAFMCLGVAVKGFFAIRYQQDYFEGGLADECTFFH